MNIDNLLEDLRGRGIQLWLEKDQLHYRAPKGTLQPATLKLLAENKAEIYAHLAARQKVKSSDLSAQTEPDPARQPPAATEAAWQEEPGEIERALMQHPDVRQAIVTAVAEPSHQEKRLTAYVVLRSEQEAPQERYAGSGGTFAYGIEQSYDAQQALDLRFGRSSIREDIPPHTQKIALYPPEKTHLLQRYRERLSSRTFRKERITFEQFSAFLGALCRIELEGLPKYLYPSAGGIYPVETYLFIKPDRIENIPAGFYYYNPDSHQLALLSNEGHIDSSMHGAINQTIFAESAFSLFLIGQLRAISSVYRNAARDFCLLEAGYMSQLLMLEAPKHQIGLCPIGDMAFEPIRRFFLLGESHVFLHSLLGGKADPAALTGWSFLPEQHQSSFDEHTSPALTEDVSTRLQHFLEAKLPRYMIPSSIVVVDALPFTSNGQHEHKNLPLSEEMPASKSNMNTGNLLEDLRERGIQVWLEKDQLRYRAPKGTLHPATLKLLAENKAEIYAHLAARQRAGLKTRPFRFGVAIERGVPSREEWVTLARRAEALGYATLLLPDHFITEFPPLVTLMAAADTTTTLRIGSFVFDNDFRHPALLAKEVAALDLLSGGRFEFGIGAGWHQPEYKRAGLPFDRAGVRINRLEEALKIIKQFFVEETVTFAGNHYTVTDLVAFPKPLQRPHPPILMGGGGKKLLTLAGREANIIGLSPKVNDDGTIDAFERTEAALAQKVEWIRQAAGERFAAVELNLFPTDVIIVQDQQQAVKQYIRERGLSGVTTEQLLASPYVLIGTIEQLVERIQRWREQFGISYLAIKL
jgi:probable F420-dependent oxidoreductase